MAPCLLYLPGVIVHYNLYNRGSGDVGSSAQRYGPRSNSKLGKAGLVRDQLFQS